MTGGPHEDDASERLRRIASVTDSALTQLGHDDLLDELLGRVRDALDCDTAVVLLLDRKTDDLVATAAVGIEEEVRQGVRIPLGAGFAGIVAAEARPVVIEEIDATNVRNPLLREHGLHSLLGAPLVVDGQVIGVIHVGSLTSRRFDDRDVELLQLVADRVALAVDTNRARVERSAARALQRSLIPGRLPTIPGLDLAARYLPAVGDRVGGDWYDVFTLPLGRLGVVIGDVVGHGLDAAVVMGRLRSALRAYALEWTDPAEVLTRLDRKLQHFEPGQMTTVLYLVVDPSFGRVSVSSAGHPLPLVVTPDGHTRRMGAVVDPPLGVGLDLARRTTEVDLEAGSVVALFTDGLVERRGRPIDEGLDRLGSVLAAPTAEQSCTQVVTAMLGDLDPADDVALLVLRPGTLRADEPLVMVVPAVPASLAQVRGGVRRWLATVGVAPELEVRVLLGVGEAATNAVEHAYGPGEGVVEVRLGRTGSDLEATVCDRGRWRSPRGQDRGRGLSIIEECADRVDVARADTGTCVTMCFRVGTEEDR